MHVSFRPLRVLLRQIGLEVSYAKYWPLLTDRKVYATLLPDTPIKIIFDVGANIGQTAERFRSSFPQAEIFCFEPFRKNFEALKQNLGRQPKIKPFQIALGDFSGQKDLLVDNLPGSQYNSLASWRQQRLKGASSTIERVTCSRGDEFCKLHRILKIDILKTDTEGFDLPVLTGFSGMLRSKKVAAVCVEVGFLTDQSHSSMRAITQFLTGFGYELAGFYETVYSSGGRVEYTNALFVLDAA